MKQLPRLMHAMFIKGTRRMLPPHLLPLLPAAAPCLCWPYSSHLLCLRTYHHPFRFSLPVLEGRVDAMVSRWGGKGFSRQGRMGSSNMPVCACIWPNLLNCSGMNSKNYKHFLWCCSTCLFSAPHTHTHTPVSGFGGTLEQKASEKLSNYVPLSLASASTVNRNRRTLHKVIVYS